MKSSEGPSLASEGEKKKNLSSDWSAGDKQNVF